MSLIDELPTKHIVFGRINFDLRNQIEKDVPRYIETGGVIKKYAIGETADFQTINAKAEAIKRGGQNGANTTKLTAKLKNTEV